MGFVDVTVSPRLTLLPRSEKVLGLNPPAVSLHVLPEAVWVLSRYSHSSETCMSGDLVILNLL